VSLPSDGVWVSLADVLFYFSINGNRYILSGCDIPELHDAVPFPRKFPPSAGLVWVLLDRLILLALHVEAHSLQALIAGPSDRNTSPLDESFSLTHDLLGDGLHELKIEHVSHFASEVKPRIRRLFLENLANDRSASTFYHFGSYQLKFASGVCVAVAPVFELTGHGSSRLPVVAGILSSEPIPSA
jgi:hypothetical protein